MAGKKIARAVTLATGAAGCWGRSLIERFSCLPKEERQDEH
jgi:hypothetical protein